MGWRFSGCTGREGKIQKKFNHRGTEEHGFGEKKAGHKKAQRSTKKDRILNHGIRIKAVFEQELMKETELMGEKVQAPTFKN